MTRAEAVRCLRAVASYMERVDDSPRAAKDIREAVRILTSSADTKA
jgi:hypothetical protein